jgi:plasmid maintenance system killer protein
MTFYRIEILKDGEWELKDWSHSKIPTQEKALTRKQELIDEGQDESSIRVVEDNGPESPLDSRIPGNTFGPE